MISAADQALIDQGLALINSLPRTDLHTVAAVVRDLNGKTYEGVNLYHFTGGPCGEPVALANAAAQRAAPLEVIVAVSVKRQTVLAPCGRCRQILFDYHPNIDVLVPTENGVRRVSLRELLPFTYLPPEVNGELSES